MGKHLFPILSCFILSGCLMQQKYPQSNNNPQSTTIQGAIVMRDWHGRAIEKPEGEVLAQFAQSSSRNSQTSLGLKLPSMVNKQRNFRAPTQCEIIREPKTKPSAVATMVNVGKVSFGSSADDLQPLVEGENHLYRLGLSSNFAEGIYIANVDGTSTTPRFSVKMSMPQRMSHVLVQGQDFETSATAFRKSESLNLSWDAPTAEMDLKVNQVEVEVISETDTEIVSVLCGAVEKDLLTQSTTVNWEIPTTYLKALNATPAGFVIFRRGQWMKASSAEVGVVSFEGVRIYATQALIAE